MEFNDSCIVLKVGTFREADLWLRLLSASRGVFSAFAFGGSKSRRRFSGCLDLFNEVIFHVKSDKQGEYLALQEGVLTKGPSRLRRDWRRMGIAVNCAGFLDYFQILPDGAAEAHSLFSSLLNALEEQSDIPPLLPMFFRARLAAGQGYALDPGFCAICGKVRQAGEEAVLPINSSGLMCRSCAATGFGGQRFILGPESLDLLEHIFSEPLDGWKLESFSGEAQKQCARAVDGFLQFNAGIYWDKGRFRKN
jgi:DNA repair protein RecO (recombination protein O)